MVKIIFIETASTLTQPGKTKHDTVHTFTSPIIVCSQSKPQQKHTNIRMKIQTILLCFAYASAAGPNDEEAVNTEVTTSLDSNSIGECVRRCHLLRITKERQDACVRDCEYTHGIARFIDELEEDEKEAIGTTSSSKDEVRVEDTDNDKCVRQCRNLRTTKERQVLCIEDKCGDLTNAEGFASADDDDSDDTPARRWKDDIEEEDFDQECVSSCDRLRFGPQKKEECIAKCASSFISPTATPPVVDGDDGSENKERARDSYYFASVF
jgi:hypothetical protein